MSYRSTPAFAVGGVSWLDHRGEPGDLFTPVPGGWRCFHCNAHFTDPRAALRHFGFPLDQEKPACLKESTP